MEAEVPPKWDRRYMAIHGWIMWLAFAIFGFVSIYTGRYMRQYWQYNMWIHGITGGIVFILNLIYGLGAIYE